jgi:hypothetical protein
VLGVPAAARTATSADTQEKSVTEIRSAVNLAALVSPAKTLPAEWDES